MSFQRASYDIGIVGGGQLGRMLGLAAIPLGLRCLVLDPEPQCPASAVADVVVGNLHDAAPLYELVSRCTVTTFEIEHTDPTVLMAWEKDGACFRPSPRVIDVVSDKFRQKTLFSDAGLPVPPVLERCPTENSHHTRTVIQKVSRGGYDGRGVARVAPGMPFPLSGDTFVEEAVDIDREIAVVLCVEADGNVTTWEPVEMIFDPTLHLVSEVIVPSTLTPTLRSRALDVARGAADALTPLGLVGTLAVELFVTATGEVLLNEVAPRPHNSGHPTMESSACSQFEQHVRAVAGYPAAPTTLLSPAAMANLVAPETTPEGPYKVTGVDAALACGDVHLHLYGKPTVRPGRKMGHLTARGVDAASAQEAARRAAALIAFTSAP